MSRRAHKIGRSAPAAGSVATDVSRQFEQLTEIVGGGAPLDSMARARALGIVALLERVLTNGAAQRTLERLRELVDGHESGRGALPRGEGERGERLVAVLDEVRGAIYDERPEAAGERLRRREELAETH